MPHISLPELDELVVAVEVVGDIKGGELGTDEPIEL